MKIFIVFKDGLRRHGAIVALALLVGVIYGSHHLFILRELGGAGGNYHPLTFAAHADASVYGIRANAVYYGQWLAGDISMPEQAGNPATLPLLNPLIMGGLGRLLGSLDRALIVSDFLFPPLIFIGLYFLAFELTRRRALAIFFATFFIFIPEAALSIPPVSRSLLHTFLQRVLPDASGILYFVRFEYPKLTFLFSVPALYGMLRAIRREDEPRNTTLADPQSGSKTDAAKVDIRGERWSVWLSGISFGLMFYTYLYDWVYFFIALSLVALMLAYAGRRSACLRLAKIAGIGFIISLPYWYNFALLRQLPQYREIASRIGIETGRYLRWTSMKISYLRIAVLVGVLAYIMPKRERIPLFYLAGLLLAYIAAVNIQLVTGFNPHPDHWYRISFLPIALAVLTVGYWAASRFISARILVYGTTIALIATGLIFTRSLASQYSYGKQSAQYYVVEAPYAAAYAWLTEHAATRASVASISYDTSNELTLYTPQRTFLLNGLHTTAGDRKIWERFMETGVIFNVSDETFSTLMKNKNLIFYLFLNEYGDNTFNATFRNDANSERRIPSDVAQRMAEAYAHVRAEEKPEDIAAQMDYLLTGPREELIESPQPPKNMEKAYDAMGVRIYKTIRQ